MRWSVSYFLGSKRNRKKIWFKLNQCAIYLITNILMKVSVSGSTSLKVSEKKSFTNHGVRKTTVSKLKKANLIYCNFRIYRHCQRPQRYKFPQRLLWSRRRRATMTPSCNIQMNNKNPSAEKKTNIILILAGVSDISTTVASTHPSKNGRKSLKSVNQKKNEKAVIGRSPC